MIYVGLDDTDTLDTPGTNQLARHLVRQVAADWDGQLIVRHQLLEHPDVPCTRKNGCASILFAPRGTPSVDQLTQSLRKMILDWCLPGSDPGLCVTSTVPQAVIDWGSRCKTQLVDQSEARRLAATHDIYLEGLGGTSDGVIGALAAVGLIATGSDGRVIHLGSEGKDLWEIGGLLPTETILACGISEIRDVDTQEQIHAGSIDVGKRLRPNYRGGRAVLYVCRKADSQWDAVRMT